MPKISEVDTLDCEEPNLNVVLSYPRSRPTKGVCIDLSDVRAAPGIRVSYDFERDGWVVERPVNGPEEGERWQEYGFFTAWNMEEPSDG